MKNARSPSWQEIIAQGDFDEAYAPGPFTNLLVDGGQRAIEHRESLGLVTSHLAELGAYDGLVGIFFAKHADLVTATDIDERLIRLIKENQVQFGVPNFEAHLVAAGNWLPAEINWDPVDLFLINPPSLPEPPGYPDAFPELEERPSYPAGTFGGYDGRSHLRDILLDLSRGMGQASGAVIVSSDYILDGWLNRKCRKLGLEALELIRRSVTCGKGELDWELRHHIMEATSWEEFSIKEDSITFDLVAYYVTHRNLD